MTLETFGGNVEAAIELWAEGNYRVDLVGCVRTVSNAFAGPTAGSTPNDHHISAAWGPLALNAEQSSAKLKDEIASVASEIGL